MHHLFNMFAVTSHRRRVPRAFHHIATWAMLVALLGSIPESASSRNICSMGMAQAGPDCPRCHGHEGDGGGGASKAPCCREVLTSAPSATAPATVSTPTPAPSGVAFIPATQFHWNGAHSFAPVAESPPHPQFSQASSVNLRL